MRIEARRTCAAAPEVVWAAIADVAAWPRRCPVFARTALDGPLAVGARVTVLQPGMRVVVWTVDEVSPGRLLRWSNRGPGFLMVAERALRAQARGTTIHLSLTVTGPMAWAVSLIVRRPMRRYLAREAGCLAGLQGAGP